VICFVVVLMIDIADGLFCHVGDRYASDLFCLLAFILFVLVIIMFLTLDFRLAVTSDSNMFWT
jgi:hypothetical protein